MLESASSRMLDQFSADVDAGLSRASKSLPSKYFYDARGDELFMQIMELPEYYLTRAELEIFTEQTEQMMAALGVMTDQPFELIELGAGDGTKTSNLLSALLEQGHHFDYLPVDISRNVLDHLQTSLESELPDLTVQPQHGDYFQILERLHQKEFPKVVLFLGSNMGNLTDKQANRFIYQLGANLDPGDKLLLGVDRIKPAEVVLPAYDDSLGVTREFNLNLLRRINTELGGGFDLEAFDHCPEYSEHEGVARSYLVSLANQEVHIESTGRSYVFCEGEKILTEISRKYNDQILQDILLDTDFEIIEVLTDSNNLFADYVIERQL